MKRNDRMETKRQANSGFTLVELLMVVCILGILYAGARLVFSGQDNEARITVTRGSIETIEQAIQMFSMKHNGKFPDTLEELTQGTDDSPGLLKEGALNDSWGTPFSYTKQGKRFKIVSAGPDLEIGTDDDITN
ncbi:MAG: type II secretion system protein GspG [Kiritimatiellae bacterium]|nr:type II secretion system protein GspG [Kiritimatiellia bacterium]